MCAAPLGLDRRHVIESTSRPVGMCSNSNDSRAVSCSSATGFVSLKVTSGGRTVARRVNMEGVLDVEDCVDFQG